MKCVPVLGLTLASAMLVATGCKKDTDQAKPADTTGAPAVTAPQSSGDPNEVIASVGEIKFLRKNMDEMVNALVSARGIPADQQTEAREYFGKDLTRQFVLKTMLINEAKKQSLAVSDEDRATQLTKMGDMLKQQGKTIDDYYKEYPLGEQAAKSEIEDGLLINKLIDKEVLSKIEVAKEDIDKLLEDIKAQNAAIEEANKNLDASKAESKKKIEDIKKQLDGGADFAELAKANSDCPSGKNGGDLGEFARGSMVKPFEDAAFTQEIGKVGDIVETQFGYHLIKVTAKAPAVEAAGDTPAKPESVTASHILVKTESVQQPQPLPTEEQVSEHLKQGKSREGVQKYIADLKAATKFETVFTDLEF